MPLKRTQSAQGGERPGPPSSSSSDRATRARPGTGTGTGTGTGGEHESDIFVSQNTSSKSNMLHVQPEKPFSGRDPHSRATKAHTSAYIQREIEEGVARSRHANAHAHAHAHNYRGHGQGQ
jgi:hypothetical protein